MYALVWVIVLLVVLNMLFSKRHVIYRGVYVKNDKHKAATREYLSELRRRSRKLVHLLTVNPPEYFNSQDLQTLFKWNGVIEEIESHEVEDDVLAYNQNKGEKIAICVKTSEDGFNKVNEGMFVLIHELAHVMTVEYSHDAQFWEYFAKLLRFASAHGLYVPKDYNNFPETFCGVALTHTPL